VKILYIYFRSNQEFSYTGANYDRLR